VILVNGSPALTLHMEAGAQAAPASLELSESAWIAASNPWATTSPIYAIVDGRPIRGPVADICEVRRYVDHLVDLVERRRIDLGAERRLALETYAEVAAELDVRLAEAGAAGC
jgi:hypothetical protein